MGPGKGENRERSASVVDLFREKASGMGVSCAPFKEFESPVKVADCGVPLGQPERADNPAVHIAKVGVVKIPSNPA